jgi:hypothetical protein
VAGVGEQRQAPGQQPADQLDQGDGRRQGEDDGERPRGGPGAVSVAVVVSVSMCVADTRKLARQGVPPASRG